MRQRLYQDTYGGVEKEPTAQKRRAAYASVAALLTRRVSESAELPAGAQAPRDSSAAAEKDSSGSSSA